jgi:hypothetical protein
MASRLVNVASKIARGGAVRSMVAQRQFAQVKVAVPAMRMGVRAFSTEVSRNVAYCEGFGPLFGD